MRDIVFILAFVVLLYFALRRPFVAVSLWLWTGLFVPNHWLYGFAESFSYNTIFAVVTMIGFAISRNKPKFKPNILIFLVVLFLVHVTITSYVNIGYPSTVWKDWENFVKTVLLFTFVTLLIREKHQINLYVWVIVLSVGFLGLVEGLKFISSGGTHQIKGPNGNILSDNNHMAVALCMTLPLIVYLHTVTQEKIIRLGLIAMMLICTLAILGTHSRGGFVGLIIVGGYFWTKSRSKIKSLVGIGLIIFVASIYLPSSWFNRMDTIETALEDNSFTNRLNSWKIHTLMAMDRPLTGGGFKACQYGFNWRVLALDLDKLDFVPTPPIGEKAWAAHSIYFQVLGDHGFIGLFIFLSILGASYLKLRSVGHFYRRYAGPDDWRVRLSRMLEVSLIAYGVAGAAVSLSYVELLYGIIALISCLVMLMSFDTEEMKRLKREEREKHKPARI